MNFIPQPNEIAEAAKPKSFELVPTGRYKGRVVEAEAGFSSRGTPEFMTKVMITEGEHEGRFVWNRAYNYETQRWSRQLITELVIACGLQELTDPSQVIGLPLEFKVKVKKASGGYDEGREIGNFYPAQQQVAQPQPQVAPPQPHPQVVPPQAHVQQVVPPAPAPPQPQAIPAPPF